MYFRNPAFLGFLSLLAVGATPDALAQITIDGITDRTVYPDSVSFRVQTNASYTYAATLNGQPVAPGIFHLINRMDYYDLAVTATPAGGGAPTTALRQFVVQSSQRGDPERGLIEWTPYPPIDSAAAEFSGARLHIITPRDYPLGFYIPVVAWVADDAGRERLANGRVSASGFEASGFRVLRGHGFGLLPPATNGGVLAYNARLQTLQTNKQINVETSTAWTQVSGTLSGAISWPDNSRIHVTGDLTIPAGSTLTVGAGAIVRLNAGVNIVITNGGRCVINGTTDQPAVFTATNRVAPERHTGAWGGFIVRNNGAELIANGVIMTGAGAASSFNFAPGASHRSEQALLLVQSGARAFLTNCYLINNAGQIGNGYNSDVTYDHCLLQRAITAGEYEGGTIIVNHSAVIEFPAVDGIVDANIADADYDAIYFTTGTHILMNSLFGFCKDDAIDSGSGGPGTVLVTNCWVESALHEGLAWSGEGRQTWTYDTVVMNSGQGLECGWSTGNNSPLCYAGSLLSLGNSVGARFGDNYPTIGSGLNGFLRVTNSIILHNYRDVWGMTFRTDLNGWFYRVAQMDIFDNFLPAPNTNHPNNQIWNPPADGLRLAPFMTTPPDAPVGVGLAVWPNLAGITRITNGVPVRLSSFTTNPVTVSYTVESPSSVVTSGSLTFAAGETLKLIPVSIPQPQVYPALRVTLSSPVNGVITDAGETWFLNLPTNSTGNATTLIARGANWRYRDAASAASAGWQDLGFNDSGWLEGPAQLGFSNGEENDEATLIADNNQITSYFRHRFSVADLSAFTSLSLWMLRDDGGVAYLNGTEIFRSPNLPAPPAAITYSTTTMAPNGENTIDNVTLGLGPLAPGTNILAVEIHQQSATSSDVSFDFELLGNRAPRLEFLRFGDDLLLYWNDPTFALEQAESLSGTWTVVNQSSPVAVQPTGSAFYRLRR
jgi:hypothetical protein